MKQYIPYFPALALVLVAALWLRHGSGETTALQTAIATQRAALVPPPPPDDRAADAAESEAITLTENNAALRAELRLLEEATGGTQKETASAQMKLPPSLDTEITESFGRITDIGAEVGQLIRLMSPDSGEREKRLRDSNPEEFGGSVMKAFNKFLAWAPAISALEETPSEIAALQSAVLRETFALNDTQTRRAEALIKARFTTMQISGLTYSSHEAPGWRERRSASLTQLLWQLRPMLPANSHLLGGLAGIVNIGAGIETKAIGAGTETQVISRDGDASEVPKQTSETETIVMRFPELARSPLAAR